MRRQKVALHLGEQIQTSVGLLLANPAGWFQILNLQSAINRVAAVGAGLRRVLADHERSMARTEKARTESALTDDAEGRDTDKIGQLGAIIAQLLGEQCANRGILNRPLRQVAGSQEEGGPAMIAFLAVQAANDGHVLHVLG